MAILTYTSAAHGFGVTYDDARLTHVDDPADPRLLATRTSPNQSLAFRLTKTGYPLSSVMIMPSSRFLQISSNWRFSRIASRSLR